MIRACIILGLILGAIAVLISPALPYQKVALLSMGTLVTAMFISISKSEF